MDAPAGFSWIEQPLLAALAQPEASEDLLWLRQQGIDVLLSLTEERPRRDWVNEAGLLVFHEPMQDMEAPSQEQLDRVEAIVNSMTRKERQRPSIIDLSRRKRIATGSGTNVEEVGQLIKQFDPPKPPEASTQAAK